MKNSAGIMRHVIKIYYFIFVMVFHFNDILLSQLPEPQPLNIAPLDQPQIAAPVITTPQNIQPVIPTGPVIPPISSTMQDVQPIQSTSQQPAAPNVLQPINPIAQPNQIVTNAPSAPQPIPISEPIQPVQSVAAAPASPILSVQQVGLQKPVVIGQFKENAPEEDANIYLNFENASLMSVINYLGEQKNINLVPNKDLEAIKVTLTTRNPLTLDRAWNVLLTLLEMNGFTLVDVDSLYRIVPNKDNGKEPLPTYSSGSGVEPENLPDSDLVVRYVYFFQNMRAETAQNILGKMLNEGNVIINRDLNIALIKDQSLNIKAAMKIVKELDLGGYEKLLK